MAKMLFRYLFAIHISICSALQALDPISSSPILQKRGSHSPSSKSSSSTDTDSDIEQYYVLKRIHIPVHKPIRMANNPPGYPHGLPSASSPERAQTPIHAPISAEETIPHSPVQTTPRKSVSRMKKWRKENKVQVRTYENNRNNDILNDPIKREARKKRLREWRKNGGGKEYESKRNKEFLTDKEKNQRKKERLKRYRLENAEKVKAYEDQRNKDIMNDPERRQKRKDRMTNWKIRQKSNAPASSTDETRVRKRLQPIIVSSDTEKDTSENYRLVRIQNKRQKM